MHTGVGHRIAPDQLVHLVDVDVVLVAVVTLPMLLGPACASSSFCRFMFGLSSQPSGVSPALICLFASRVFRFFGTFSAVGGGVAKAFPTKNLNTWSQLKHFGPKSIGGLFNSNNSAWLWGSALTSSGICSAANFVGSSNDSGSGQPIGYDK